MNNKGIGAIFCLISAQLMGSRYLSAAIFISNINSWSEPMFQSALQYVGSGLKAAAIVSLIVGILFLAAGIIVDLKQSGILKK